MIKHTGRNRLNHSGVPLGGIGTGKIDFCPNGKFTNVTTNNNAVAHICVDKATSEYVVTPQGIPGAFLACFVEGYGARILKTHSFEGYGTLKRKEIRYQGLFPRALVRYPEMAGVSVELEAFSSLQLDDDGSNHYKDSSLPAAVFLFRLKNNLTARRQISVAMSWRNLTGLGGYPRGCTINDLRGNYVSFEADDDWQGLWFGSKRRKVDPRFEGNYALTAGGGEMTYMAGWSPGVGNESDFWTVFSRDGRLNGFCGKGQLGAICASVWLEPGETQEIPIVLAWYFPNLIGDTDERPYYGTAYSNWFKDSKEVACYLLDNYPRLLEGIWAWQNALLNSSLPRWLAIKCITDIFPIVANSFYTKDFRFSILEAHPSMSGCLGTIDQRAASNSIYTMCFPELCKSELSLFANQQITEDNPYRFGKHWNFKTGKKDLDFDNKGAIRHEVGWDHLEGGDFGRKENAQTQWPDLATVFVLQCYEYIIWSGDRDFLDFVYPKVKLALEYESRLDQNGDGVADLWGPGTCTFDNPIDYPMYGASPFIASLHLAALEAARQMALLKGDQQYVSLCEAQAAKIRETMEMTLWSDQLQHFYLWYDNLYENWKTGPRPHESCAESNFIAQVAGQWFAHLFNFGYLFDPTKLRKALKAIKEQNHLPVQYCPANVVLPDGRITSSWPYYAEVYYAINSMYEDEIDAGFDCFRRIYEAMHKLDKSPWDAPLGWDYHLYPGNLPKNLPTKSRLRDLLHCTDKANRYATWGRWYMSNPASWFILPALSGFSINLLQGEIVIAPNLPKAIGRGKKAKQLPIFMPQFWGSVSYEERENRVRIGFELTRFIGKVPLMFKRFITKIPRGVQPEELIVRVFLNEKELIYQKIEPDFETRNVRIEVPFTFEQKGDRIECVLRWRS